MGRAEIVELAVLCLVHKDGYYLLQDRVKEDWKGFALPGGHIEKDESVVDAVIREMKEETGLTILHPRLCGVKQFPGTEGRYLVFLFETQEFEGLLKSSDEGRMHWIHKDDIASIAAVADFEALLQVMLDDSLTEFIYDQNWNVILK